MYRSCWFCQGAIVHTLGSPQQLIQTGGPFVAIGLARQREECRDAVIEFLDQTRIAARRSDGNAVGGIREGEVVHGGSDRWSCSTCRPQPPWLVPSLPNRTEVVVAPEAAAVGPDIPGIIRKAHHGRKSLGQIDIATNVLFAPIRRHAKILGEIVRRAWIRVGRVRISLAEPAGPPGSTDRAESRWGLRTRRRAARAIQVGVRSDRKPARRKAVETGRATRRCRVKSPPFSATVGTRAVLVGRLDSCLFHSCDQKKKILSFLIGPPMV